MINLFLEMLGFLGCLIVGTIIAFVGFMLILFVVATLRAFFKNDEHKDKE